MNSFDSFFDEKGRFFSLSEYPNPDQDDDGDLILWVDDGTDDSDCECVHVMPEGDGWREVL